MPYKDPEDRRAFDREYYQRNKDKKREEQRARSESINRRVWRRLLRDKYGISEEQYNEGLRRQGGKCAICGATEGRADTSRLFVDHNHETGQVRGLLCCTCNAGIGMLKDSPELLARATAYVRRPPGMRILKITENHGQVVVETSAGIRTSGATVESALRKLFVIEDATPGSFAAVERVFAMIPDTPGPSQIGQGVAAA